MDLLHQGDILKIEVTVQNPLGSSNHLLCKTEN